MLRSKRVEMGDLPASWNQAPKSVLCCGATPRLRFLLLSLKSDRGTAEAEVVITLQDQSILKRCPAAEGTSATQRARNRPAPAPAPVSASTITAKAGAGGAITAFDADHPTCAVAFRRA